MIDLAKGKQERHYLTIQRRFYKEADKSGLTTLQELNEFFWAWLEQCYHQAKHKGIGMPPLERWQMEEHLIERLSLETLEQKMQRRTYRGVDFNERHYLTIQRSFYKEAQHAGLQTLEELNEFFWAWLDERYHNETHSTLNQTPLARWQAEEQKIERVPLKLLAEALKLRVNRKVNFKTTLLASMVVIIRLAKV